MLAVFRQLFELEQEAGGAPGPPVAMLAWHTGTLVFLWVVFVAENLSQGFLAVVRSLGLSCWDFCSFAYLF